MARLSRIAAGLAIAGLAGAAQAEPVSIIGGLIAMGAAQAAGVTLSAIAFAGVSYGALAFAAGSLVFGYANAQRKARKAERAARDAYNSKVQDRLVSGLSTAAPWQIIYGQAEVGGSIEAILTSGARDEFKHLVISFAAHQCAEIVDVKIAGESLGALDADGYVTGGKYFKADTQVHTEAVTFDGTGTGSISRGGATLKAGVIPASAVSEQYDPVPEQQLGLTLVGTTVTGGPPGGTAMVSYTVVEETAMVRVRKHLGDPGQAADASLLAECPGQWEASDRLRGVTYIVLRLNLTEAEFQGGPPTVTAVIKGKLLYDHRDGTTAWSANNALCTADFLRAEYGKNARDNQMVWSTVDAAANVCDEYSASVGGPRYTCNGAFTTAQDPDQVLEDLLASMAGWADCTGGWRIGAGAWTAPVTAITDEDASGPAQVLGGAELDALFNGVRGQFNDPTKYGVATDYTPYKNAAFVSADGQELWDDHPLPFTNTAQRATNLARIRVEAARGETLSYQAKMRIANRVRTGDRVLLQCGPLQIDAESYRVVKREETPGRGFLLTLQQDSEGVWDEADATAEVPSSSGGLADPFVVPPVIGLTASSGEEYALVTATSVVPRIKVTVDQPQYLTDQLQVEWRTSTSDTWQALTVTPGQQSAFIESVNQGITYIVRARWFRPSVGKAGDWRVTVLTVTGKTSVPPAFDVFAVNEADTGMRVFTFGYTTTPQPVDWRGAEIRAQAGNHPAPTWGAMTPLASAGTYFTASPVETQAPGSPGVWTFACRSRDAGGGLSPYRVVVTTLDLVAPEVYVPDTTPPPTPTGATFLSALNTIFIEHDTPGYSQGHGHSKTRVYGVDYGGTGPLPTFADAVPLLEFTGTFQGMASTLGTEWHLWLVWESVDGVESAPAGGANGYTVATGRIGTTDLGPLIVEAQHLATNAVEHTKIDDDAIRARHLAANSIAVGTAAVEAGAIVRAMIGLLAVDTARIDDLAVTEAKIGALAVTNAKIGAFIKSDTFDGTIDGGGNITADGTTGWAIDKAGRAVFSNVRVRRLIDSSSGQLIPSVAATSWQGDVADTGVDTNSDGIYEPAPYTNSTLRLYGADYHSGVPFNQRARYAPDSGYPLTFNVHVSGISDAAITLWSRVNGGSWTRRWTAESAGIAGDGFVGFTFTITSTLGAADYVDVGVTATLADNSFVDQAKRYINALTVGVTCINV